MKISLSALAIVLGSLAALEASAAVLTYTVKGTSCTSFKPGVAGIISQWGLKTNTTMDVTCPVILPTTTQSTGVHFTVAGYNRTSTDNLNCTFMSTDYQGGNAVTRTLYLTYNAPQLQQKSERLSIPNGNHFYSVTCHIPAGENYLTGIYLGMEN